MSRLLSFFVGLGLILSIAGCATGRERTSDSEPSTTATGGEEPAPAYKLSEDRKMAPQDVLELTVVGEKDLEKIAIAIPASGMIDVTYIDNPVKAAGKTPIELKKELETLWKLNTFVKPEVLLTVKTFRKKFISVEGKVMKPGVFELPDEQKIDIRSAIARAEGFAPTANQNQIILNRPGRPNKTYRYKDLIKITDPAKKIYLEPEDQIFVGESVF